MVRPWRRIIPFTFALGVVGFVRLGLSMFGYNRLRRYVPAAHHAAPAETLRLLAWSVRRAAPLVPGATCLTQALAGQFLLARRGFKSTIKVGVREEGGKILAHAWLISGDIVVIGGAGTDLRAYTPIADLAPR